MSCFARLCVLGAERLLVRFAHGGLGNRLEKLNCFRRLERSLATRHQCSELLRSHRVPRPQYSQCRDGLTPLGMRHADHRALRYRGMFGQDVLDLPRIHIEPAGDDHVFGAVNDSQETAGVANGNIPGMQPVTRERFSCQLRAVPIPVHHQGAANTDLPWLAFGYGLIVGVQQFNVDPRKWTSAASEATQVSSVVLSLS